MVSIVSSVTQPPVFSELIVHLLGCRMLVVRGHFHSTFVVDTPPLIRFFEDCCPLFPVYILRIVIVVGVGLRVELKSKTKASNTKCLVAALAEAVFSCFLCCFRETCVYLDALLRYEVETTARATV